MAALYAVAAWLIVQVAGVLIDLAKLPDWVGTTTLWLLIIGFPIALIFSWFYEITPEGISLEKDVDPTVSITHVTGRRLDFIVISMLCAAVILFAYDKWWTAAPEQQSIAVLPFVNMSDDPNNEYFSDGISEEILNLLAKIPELHVTSRSSAFSFKGQNLNVPTMAAKLNVAHVLEGSVRKSGNQLRITTQLIEVDTDKHLWSETYDRELKNVFAIQDEIAKAVVGALRITLLGEIPNTNEPDPEAFALYLQARHFERQRTAESSRQAETLLLQALDIDPGFASAWAELGRAYMNAVPGAGRNRSIAEIEKLSRHAVQQALSIDPQNSQANLLQSNFEIYFDWDFTAVSRQLEIMQLVLESNPGDVDTLGRVARLNRMLGRLDEAIDLRRQILVLDPLSAGNYRNLGLDYLAADRLEEAAHSFQFARSLMPGRLGLQLHTGFVLLAQGDAPAALVAIEQETSGLRPVGMAIVQHALGDDGASEFWLQEFITCCAAEGAFQIAYVYAFRGEIDLAFDWLEQAYDNRDGGLGRVLTHPMLANLYGDPRWEAFIDKMGLLH